MFEYDGDSGLTAAAIDRWVAALARAPGPEDDAERIDLLRALECLTCAADGYKAVVTADFDRSRRAEAAAAGVPAERQARGVAAQVGLARRESPHRGNVHLGLARVLDTEMPCTRTALRTGRITEWRATVLVRETACLTRENRARIDEDIARDLDRLEAWGERELIAEIQRMAYRLEPKIWVNRRAKAVQDRRVTIRPEPDCMVRISALLPMVEGIAVHTTLRQAADSGRAVGDDRSVGQIMADALIERVLAGSGAQQAPPVPVAVNLVVSDATLLAGADEPARLDGYGPIPADVAREVARSAADDQVATLRRVYATPAAGAVVAMDSVARTFPPGLVRLIKIRDGTCRTPYCDAPVRHIDHIEPAERGGPTSYANGQGLCQACNHHKQAGMWYARTTIDGSGRRHTVETTTPTGHRYRSTAPRAPTPLAS